MAGNLPAARLTELAQQPLPAALAALAADGLLTAPAAGMAVELALAQTPAEPAQVMTWLPLLEAWVHATGDEPTLALLYYAQARLASEGGDLDTAEARLQAARAIWHAAGDATGLARSGLGLTQVLAMQGRLAEAEALIRATVAGLDAAADAELRPLALDARQNLATLLSYQERHAEALALTNDLRAACLAELEQSADPNAAATWQMRLGQVERDCALAHTYLDQAQQAEVHLLSAVERLGLPEARVERGQARTNLGHLYTRTGRYAQALAQLDAATRDLLGSDDAESARERWPVADVLFLEQAALYLALNLLPEAERSLQRAQPLFAAAQQQYELGQVHYLIGVLETRRADATAASAALAEAETLFRQVNNPYWLHRVRLAQAAAALRSNNLPQAGQLLDSLLAEKTAGAQAQALAWDQISASELHLLDAQRHLAAGDLPRTGEALAAVAAALGLSSPEAEEPALPFLQISLLHIAGLAARAGGRTAAAHSLLGRAVASVEEQRGLLPIEELRAAFLTDKDAIYADLILSLLDLPDAPPTTVAAAFDLVERARSRSLLERLLAAMDDVPAGPDQPGLPRPAYQAVVDTRTRLASLYDQLLGPGAAGSRGLAATLSEEVLSCEATLQRLEWQAGSWFKQAQPVTLAQLQPHLASDQAALVYYVAGAELMAFVVTQHTARVVRNLANAADLDAAQAQWRFQLGRVEVGGDYAERHAPRLLQGSRDALGRLHELLIAPLLPVLAAEAHVGSPWRRLLIVPYGSLHRVPFHALWDGRQYLVENYDVAYAASASLAVQSKRGHPQRWQTLAAVALSDPAIPQAEAEVRAAARHFARARLFIGSEADSDGLQAAAAAGDVLHIATHGVFRADNPFFSALKLADGWIDVRTIYRLPLAARLVVLSACESGAVQVQGGDEPIGLGRGFLGAGAQTLVLSLWNVHDASAASLMEDFYARLAGGGPAAEALCAAQRCAATSPRHPYYWAPYILMGS